MVHQDYDPMETDEAIDIEDVEEVQGTRVPHPQEVSNLFCSVCHFRKPRLSRVCYKCRDREAASLRRQIIQEQQRWRQIHYWKEQIHQIDSRTREIEYFKNNIDLNNIHLIGNDISQRCPQIAKAIEAIKSSILSYRT
jgi:hypothetical protein